MEKSESWPVWKLNFLKFEIQSTPRQKEKSAHWLRNFMSYPEGVQNKDYLGLTSTFITVQCKPVKYWYRGTLRKFVIYSSNQFLSLDIQQYLNMKPMSHNWNQGCGSVSGSGLGIRKKGTKMKGKNVLFVNFISIFIAGNKEILSTTSMFYLRKKFFPLIFFVFYFKLWK
jgi:hypothetical protein